MCTVSVIPSPGGFRLACNRDELRTRPLALPPRVARFGSRLAAMPIDPAGGGTWVAVNDAGLACALLNVNRQTPQLYVDGAACAPTTRSRGMLILKLLGCESVDDAIEHATKTHLAEFSPFRLVLIDSNSWGEVVWDGSEQSARRGAVDRPLLFTSSGLGDDIAQLPRQRLFDDLVAREANRATQDAFHRHAWADRPELSVRMSRADARTVSFTVVEVDEGRAELRYHPGDPNDCAGEVVVRIPVRSPVCT
jgi:hypothetical protein